MLGEAGGGSAGGRTGGTVSLGLSSFLLTTGLHQY